MGLWEKGSRQEVGGPPEHAPKSIRYSTDEVPGAGARNDGELAFSVWETLCWLAQKPWEFVLLLCL